MIAEGRRAPPPPSYFAGGWMELVYTDSSKVSAFGHAGSNPASPTQGKKEE